MCQPWLPAGLGPTIIDSMDVDGILRILNRNHVRYLLIGGMNFMLRHKPILTYDLDVWIEDTVENRQRCELALAELDAEWGATESDWGPVKDLAAGWLAVQGMVCVSSPHGAIDVFRSVAGLADWQSSWQQGVDEATAAGTPYRGLSDEDMLRCQAALDEGLRKSDRIRVLEEAVRNKGPQS
jgi:hypothetical protein